MLPTGTQGPCCWEDTGASCLLAQKKEEKPGLKGYSLVSFSCLPHAGHPGRHEAGRSHHLTTNSPQVLESSSCLYRWPNRSSERLRSRFRVTQQEVALEIQAQACCPVRGRERKHFPCCLDYMVTGSGGAQDPAGRGDLRVQLGSTSRN